MKRNLFLLIVAATMLIVSCTPEVKIIENPMIGITNTETLDITRVEITDSATYVNVEAYFRPKYWIKFVSGTYLQVDGKQYVITAAEGCELDKQFWMPESGRASFRFTFPPIPKRAKSMDFIEGEEEGAFQLYDIDLTGKRSYEDYYKPHPDIPKELIGLEECTEMPDPVHDIGKTKVRIKVLDYKKGLCNNITLYNNTSYGRQKSLVGKFDHETGTVEFEFMQYGTSEMFFFIDNRQITSSRIFITPNEEVDVYIDLRAAGRGIVDRRKETDYKYNPFRDMRVDYYIKSRYLEFNNSISDVQTRMNDELPPRLNQFSGTFAEADWSAEEYQKYTTEKYYTTLKKIENHPKLLPIDKELLKIELDYDFLNAIVFHKPILDLANQLKKVKPENLAKLSKEQMKEMGQVIKYTPAHELLLFDAIYTLEQYIEVPEGSLMSKAGEFQVLLDYASENIMDVDDNHWKRIADTKHEFIIKACKTAQEELRAKLAEAENRAKIEKTPDNEEKLFDDIIAPHKGKVIVVDFWNTWCGPCREAHKAIARLKEGELKDKDIVWIYIANESSPEAAYKTLIADIKGLHYRLTYREWDVLQSKFGFSGIPSYVLVDKDGKYALRNDLRYIDTMKRELLKMTEK